MNLARTFERIRFAGPFDVSFETLSELQRAFLLHVPFENLDIHLRRHIAFTPKAVYNKVVEQHRGGFCYELNSLFHDVLHEIGFDVQFHAATMFRDGQPGTPMGHMVLSVKLGETRWLVDVGNGKFVREPLNFDGSTIARAEGMRYRIEDGAGVPRVLEADEGSEWRTRFTFEAFPRERDDFNVVCEWTQSSPDSRFTQHQICTLALPDGGRVYLLDDRLTITHGTSVEEHVIDASRRDECLLDYFGIRLTL